MSLKIQFSSRIKVLFIGFAILLNLQTNAQNYLISFAGKGASTVVHNVKVENLTSGETLILHRGEILRLINIFGVSPLENNKYSMLLYPNPMTRNDAVLRIFPPDPGNALITIYGITGKIEAQSQYYLGTYPQEYRLSGLKNGLHFINVVGRTYHYSGKLVCIGNAEGTVTIDQVSGDYSAVSPAYENEEKRSGFIVNMRYTDGDRLKITGISNSYSTVKMEIPDKDKTITFDFIPCTDGDDNNYSVVEIASQLWMAENLKTTAYNDGKPIGYSDSRADMNEKKASGTYSWYDNNKRENGGVYGALYNWYAVTNGNLCPSGWHIPERQDWIVLQENLGYQNAGSKIKETGNEYWTSGINSTNESGFSALPGGYMLDNEFSGINEHGHFWSIDNSSGHLGSKGWYISYDSEKLVESDISFLNEGLSVRCLFGQAEIIVPPIITEITIPVLSTKQPHSILRTTAAAGGIIISNGGASVTASGICWSTSSNPSTADSHTIGELINDSFESRLTELIPGTRYYIRAYATNKAGTGYGDELSFITIPVAIPSLETTAVSAITPVSAASGGIITDDGGAIITKRGICLATSPDPGFENTVISNGTGTGSFTSIISGLEPGTVYHVRAFATNSAGTAFGNDIRFESIAVVPVVTTSAITAITRTTASSGGTIVTNGGESIIASGICWSTSPNPVRTGDHTTGNTADGSFEANMQGLLPNTRYYVRAYATNSIGTGYGNELSFLTNRVQVASLTTNSATSITSSSAISGGNITDDGGATITVRGICWALTSNPTIAYHRLEAGNGIGNFSITLTGLQPETTYYVRSYATNSEGTAYGPQISFTTEEHPNSEVTFVSSGQGSSLLHSVGDKRVLFTTIGTDSYLKYSSNNGVTYNQGVKVNGIFSYYNKARILANGNIVLFSWSKIYYSDDNLATINPCTVLDENGFVYALHNPANANYPGAYFNFMGGFAESNGVAVLGNYTNSAMGASPTNLYYTLDGITWKVFYTFGQNPQFTDNGTRMGGLNGTLLGDPENPLITRHVHSVNIGGDGNFYACTGDDDQEIHFLKCSYNNISDSWEVNDLLTGERRDWQRMRALGVYERDGYLYWGSDGPGTFTYRGVQYDCYGIYKCAIEDINDPAKHILLQPLTDACYSFVNAGNLVFAGLQSYGYIYISYDFGETWSYYAKPAWMINDTVQGVWFNDLYKYFVTNDGVKIESSLF